MNNSAQQRFMQAVALHQQGKLEEAKDIYESILKTQPNHADALHLLGVIANQTGQPERAVHLISKAIAIQPNNAGFYINGGNALQALGRLDEAVAYFDKAIRLQPTIPDVHFNRANALHALNKYELALAGFDQAITLKPDYAEAYNNRGRVLQALGRLDEALSSYESAIQVRPKLAEAHHNRGLVLIKLGRQVEAISSFQLAMQARSSYLEPYVELSTSLHSLGKCEEALSVLERLLQFKNDDANLWNRRGNYLTELQRYEEALDSYDRALQLNDLFYEAYFNAGTVLIYQGKYAQSVQMFDQSLAINSTDAGTYYNRGVALQYLYSFEAARHSLDQAIKYDPTQPSYYHVRGNVFIALKRFDEAIKDYEETLRIDPHYEFIVGAIINAKMKLCDWSNFDKQVSTLISQIDCGLKSSPGFPLLSIVDEPVVHFKGTMTWVDSKLPLSPTLGAVIKRAPKHTLKIGYYSADFREHPVAMLLSGVLEAHDKRKIEIFAFSSGSEVSGVLRQRIKSVADHFIDIHSMSDEQVARLSREYEIDIAIDLGGHTFDSRIGIFSFRAAPIQVSYLGYPSTTGAEYIDYFIADPVLVTKQDYDSYTEKIITLPSYQPNDRGREISDRQFTRAELGLPEKGFVFCCFNEVYKITPSVFDSWMRILNSVPDSVLWLRASNESAMHNLRREAQVRGIEADRLVFAVRVATVAEHLARQRMADLFLDTLPYNAHTTASDALWAGLPILTCKGKSFTARVASSVLTAINLPELITESSEAYEALAIELATHPEKLQRIKSKLEQNRLTTLLFDTKKYTLVLEKAYQAMYDRYQADLPPDHLVIEG